MRSYKGPQSSAWRRPTSVTLSQWRKLLLQLCSISKGGLGNIPGHEHVDSCVCFPVEVRLLLTLKGSLQSGDKNVYSEIKTDSRTDKVLTWLEAKALTRREVKAAISRQEEPAKPKACEFALQPSHAKEPHSTWKCYVQQAFGYHNIWVSWNW